MREFGEFRRFAPCCRRFLTAAAFPASTRAADFAAALTLPISALHLLSMTSPYYRCRVTRRRFHGDARCACRFAVIRFMLPAAGALRPRWWRLRRVSPSRLTAVMFRRRRSGLPADCRPGVGHHGPGDLRVALVDVIPRGSADAPRRQFPHSSRRFHDLTATSYSAARKPPIIAAGPPFRATSRVIRASRLMAGGRLDKRHD